MIRRLGCVALAGLLLPCSARPLRAEDAAGAPAAPLETRIYPIDALVRPSLRFRADRGPFAAAPDEVNDESRPLFGKEEDDTPGPLSGADLIELVKASAGAPGAWEREGTSLTLLGDRFLVARAAPAEHDGIADLLAGQARRLLATTVVDVAVLAGDLADVRGVPLGEAVAGRRARVLGFARVVVGPGGRSVAREGTARAVLCDADVEVAEDARVSDPIVGIVPEGLACAAEVVAPGAGRATVRVTGWWSAPSTISTYRTKEGDVLELSASDGRVFDATLDLEDGAWSFTPLTAGVFLGVRERATAPATDREQASGERVGAPPSGAPATALELRGFDVSALSEVVESRRGPHLGVSPSNYTPPEPPELREPFPLFPRDRLVDLVKTCVEPESWTREGASLDARGGRLLARNDAVRLAAVQRALDALRAARTRTTRVRASVVALPVASLPELWAGLDDALVADGGEGLLRRAGARLVETLGLRLRDGQRQASVSGTMRRYLGDFDVEVAAKSSIANPVTKQVFDGTSLDVAAAPIGRGGEVALELRLERGAVRELRSATSAHGPIQCPVYGVSRCLGTLTVRSGATRVAGASVVGDDAVLVLLSATRE